MKKRYFIFVLFTVIINAQFNYQRSWGTYLGDERFALGDCIVDNSGNLYVVGTVKGSDLTGLLTFTSSTAHQPTYGGGSSDGYIVKLNPNGQIVWGTFFGGEAADRVTAIDFDSQDNIYITGLSYSTTNIATQGSFQENNAGGSDAFFAKFNSSGTLLWGTYYGGQYDEGIDNAFQGSSISFDDNNAIYSIFVAYSSNLATANAFQTIPIPDTITSTNAGSNILVKFDLNGNRIWATYYGIRQWNQLKATRNNVYIVGNVLDCPPYGVYNTYYGMPNAYMAAPASCVELYLTNFSATGERLWSTYFGGTSSEGLAGVKKSIDVGENGIYFAGSSSTNYTNQEIATTGTYQPLGGGNFIAQFETDGARRWGTYNGSSYTLNSGGNNNAGVLADKSSSGFYSFGSTGYSNNITTANSYQSNINAGYKDGYVCKFSNESTKSWGTYYGGELEEQNVLFYPYDNGTKFYIIGETQSFTQIATSNGLQTSKQVFDTVNNYSPEVYNVFVAHFGPIQLANQNFQTNSFTLYPNPANQYITLQTNNLLPNSQLAIYNNIGQKVLNTQLTTATEQNIDITTLASGIYYVEIKTESETIKKQKLIIK